MSEKTIVVLEGDQTGQELLVESLRVLQPDVIGFDLAFEHYDLSLENRRKTENKVVYESGKAIRKHGYGLKAATITPEISGDVGSPNRILREEIGAQVILRSGRKLPGVEAIGGITLPISIVRMAVDGAYGAKEWREGTPGSMDERSYRTEKLSRRVCRDVAEYAFLHARAIEGKVFGGPKYTVSPTYEALFKEELDAASKRYPDVVYEPQLIDATFALMLKPHNKPLVIPSLNRDGDLLSDLVLQMFGSIAGSESLVISLTDKGEIACVMAEAPHGTAPTLEGRNLANPMAMILAAASLLNHIELRKAKKASRAIFESVLEAVHSGVRTGDLNGTSTTSEFTDEIIRRIKTKLEVWETMP